MIKTGCQRCEELSQSNWSACFWTLKIVDGNEVEVWIEVGRMWLTWHLMKRGCEWFRAKNSRAKQLDWKSTAER